MLDRITPLILTFNEEVNIERTLDALSWASEIVVIDSFSCDATADICKKNDRVRFIQREFDYHAAQWNFGLEQIDSDRWTLALDADHIVSRNYIKEVETLFSHTSEQDWAQIVGFKNGFTYYQNGHPLKGSLYPPLTALFRTQLGQYAQEGHTQRLQISGEIKDLDSKNHHDDRKPFARWATAQKRYAMLDAQKLRSTPLSTLRWTDRARVIPFLSPILVLFYTLVFKGLIFNGLPGIQYSLQRVHAEILLHIARVRLFLG